MWLSTDPLQEKYPNISTYAYTANNPVKYVDPDGMQIGDPDKEVTTGKIETIGSPTSNLLKGVDAGLNQRYQLEPPRGDTHTGIRDTHAGRVSKITGKPVGDWVIRIDQGHKGAPDPHININSKLTGSPDPHTKLPGGNTTLKVLGTSAKTLEAVGKIAKPVAITVDAVRIGNAINEDGGTIGKNTIVTSSSVAGGWAGAWGGAVVGAKGGAAIGGLVGGLFGGIGGSFAGSYIAEEGAKELVK